MSKLTGKSCPIYQSDCLIGNCALYDDRLDNCAVHIMSFNLYKVANAIEKATPEAQHGKYPPPQYRPR